MTRSRIGFVFNYQASSTDYAPASTLAGNKRQIPLNLPLEKGEVKKAKDEILKLVQNDSIKDEIPDRGLC